MAELETGPPPTVGGKSLRRPLLVLAILAVIAVIGWSYYQSLVPAIHPDHDHGLENLAGGGFLRVEGLDGKKRNLVGRPGRVLILHWFEPGSAASRDELPLLVDYAQSVAEDPDIEVVMIATTGTRQSLLEWARGHGVPTRGLYVDPGAKTAGLIGVRRLPETFIYDREGHLAHQARGSIDWSSESTRLGVENLKHGGHDHQH